MHEYELQASAEYVFKKNGALGASYFALIATGQNTYYTHYNRNTSVLADGDLVQFDYAPDFKYYQSDVTRVFPANGRFTPRQREMYEIYLELYQARADVDPGAQDARGLRQGRAGQDGRHDGVLHVHRRADQGRGGEDGRGLPVATGHHPAASATTSASRCTTSAVSRPTTFEPGRVFTIEPQFRIEEEHLGHPTRGHDPHHRDRCRGAVGSLPITVAEIEQVMKR